MNIHNVYSASIPELQWLSWKEYLINIQKTQDWVLAVTALCMWSNPVQTADAIWNHMQCLPKLLLFLLQPISSSHFNICSCFLHLCFDDVQLKYRQKDFLFQVNNKAAFECPCTGFSHGLSLKRWEPS